MSLLPRAFGSYNPSFTPLFRLLDDFNSYSRQFDGGVYGKLNPTFDIKELPDSYHLSGELPGVEHGDVDMEFTDPRTLTIHGHSERSYTSDTPAGLIEESATSATTSKGATDDASTRKGTSTTVARPEKAEQPREKYWVSERSYGEFARSFSFPTPVDQDHVQASMKNGILSVVVPKTRNQESRKITIS